MLLGVLHTKLYVNFHVSSSLYFLLLPWKWWQRIIVRRLSQCCCWCCFCSSSGEFTDADNSLRCICCASDCCWLRFFHHCLIIYIPTVFLCESKVMLHMTLLSFQYFSFVVVFVSGLYIFLLPLYLSLWFLLVSECDSVFFVPFMFFFSLEMSIEFRAQKFCDDERAFVELNYCRFRSQHGSVKKKENALYVQGFYVFFSFYF